MGSKQYLLIIQIMGNSLNDLMVRIDLFRHDLTNLSLRLKIMRILLDKMKLSKNKDKVANHLEHKEFKLLICALEIFYRHNFIDPKEDDKIFYFLKQLDLIILDVVNNRLKTSIVGTIIGDALGATNEFTDKSNAKQLTTIVGGGPFDLKIGEWTDDTSMMLCILESIKEKVTLDTIDMANKLVQWYKDGKFSVKGYCFDIGSTTRRALDYYMQNKVFISEFSDQEAGNGSLVRLAPLFKFAEDLDQIRKYSIAVTKITHIHPDCVFASDYVATLIHFMSKHEDKYTAMAHTYDILKDIYQDDKYQRILKLDYDILDPKTVPNTGYVIDTLYASLWALIRFNNFREAILFLANNGGDSDSICATYGMIAGYYYGEDSIPKEWIEKIAWKDKIIKLIEKL